MSLNQLDTSGIFKYGYGLLKLPHQELYEMPLTHFIERVEGCLLWHEYDLDAHLNNEAWFTAHVMLSSGNYKKGTVALDIKKGLYKSIEDRESERDKQDNKVEHVAAEKAAIQHLFKDIIKGDGGDL